MIKAIICLALLICGCAYTQKLPRNFHDQNSTTVRVETACIMGGPYGLIDHQKVEFDLHMFSGTGVQLDGRHVLTAYHVVTCDDGRTLWVKLANDKRYEAHLYAKDEVHDLAILEIETDDEINVIQPVIADFDYRDICIVTAQPIKTRKCGRALQVIKDPEKDVPDRNVIVTIKVEPGNSGAPIYDSAGRLVGIITKLVHTDTLDDDQVIVGGRGVSLLGQNILKSLHP
jgi:S1-C subfamily serine protease